jgi:NADPH-dependent F420 reductase
MRGADIMTTSARHIIAVIGGTGPQGKGLGYRFAREGHALFIGSRSKDRAAQTAAEMTQRLPTASVRGLENSAAAAAAEVVVIAVPYRGHDELVAALRPELAGKLVISCVNPLGFDTYGPYGLDILDRSAAEETQRIVPDARVVGAFHHVSAVTLWRADDYLRHEHVLVCGDDPEAKRVTMELARAVTGHPGVDAGRLRLARQLEPLTAVLISINKRYKTRSGIAIAGLPVGLAVP